jgi:hypothetical protein
MVGDGLIHRDSVICIGVFWTGFSPMWRVVIHIDYFIILSWKKEKNNNMLFIFVNIYQKKKMLDASFISRFASLILSISCLVRTSGLEKKWTLWLVHRQFLFLFHIMYLTKGNNMGLQYTLQIQLHKSGLILELIKIHSALITWPGWYNRLNTIIIFMLVYAFLW